MTREILFDQNVASNLGSSVIGRTNLIAAGQIDSDALALIAVARFDDHRESDLLSSRPGIVRTLGLSALGHRDAGDIEERLGERLVLGNRLRDRTRLAGLSRLNPAGATSPAKPDQTSFGQSRKRDSACGCRANDRRRAGSQTLVLIEIMQAGDGVLEVKRAALDKRGTEPVRQLDRESSDRFFAVFNDDLVGLAVCSLGDMQERDCAARPDLQPERCSS